ncbi:MAG TPA: hypothetical protein VGH32_04260, partial [Pirellulales bacterium]
RLKQITDGTSLTIGVVETSEDMAVIWTKPDDYEPDASDPAAGLGGLRNGHFIAAFIDGHVQIIPRNATPEYINALFTADGGERIDLSNVPLRAEQPARAVPAARMFVAPDGTPAVPAAAPPPAVAPVPLAPAAH